MKSLFPSSRKVEKFRLPFKQRELLLYLRELSGTCANLSKTVKLYHLSLQMRN